jgi:hypothetical protein
MRKMIESLPSDEADDATRGYDNILVSETSREEQDEQPNNT